MNEYCTHDLCRAHAAEELLYMAKRLLRPELLDLAAESRFATVRCRQYARKGPVRAPLPPRRISGFVDVQLCEIPGAKFWG